MRSLPLLLVLVLTLSLLSGLLGLSQAARNPCDPATVSYDDLLSRRCLILSRPEFLREVRRIVRQLEPGLKIDARKCGQIKNDQKYIDCVIKQVKDAAP